MTHNLLAFLSCLSIVFGRLCNQPFSQKNLLRRSVITIASSLSTLAATAALTKGSISAEECNCFQPNCLKCLPQLAIKSCRCLSPTCTYCDTLSNELTYISNNDAAKNWYNPNNERIYDVMKKSFLPTNHIQVLQKELQGRCIVSIGEVHSNPCHHRMEFDIIKSLAKSHPSSKLQIGLECFYRQHQSALDDYVFNHNDFGKLKSQTKWDNTWGYDLNQYAKIFNFACQNKIRLVGLNVPYPVVQLVSKYGLEGLPSELKVLLPTVDTSNSAHRAQFIRLIGAHGETLESGAFNRMYESQCLWDDYMADSVVKAQTTSKDNIFILIAGMGHIMGRVGIPDRIFKRNKQASFVIIPQEVNWSTETGLPEVELPPSLATCDWAWYTENEMKLA